MTTAELTFTADDRAAVLEAIELSRGAFGSMAQAQAEIHAAAVAIASHAEQVRADRDRWDLLLRTGVDQMTEASRRASAADVLAKSNAAEIITMRAEAASRTEAEDAAARATAAELKDHSDRLGVVETVANDAARQAAANAAAVARVRRRSRLKVAAAFLLGLLLGNVGPKLFNGEQMPGETLARQVSAQP